MTFYKPFVIITGVKTFTNEFIAYAQLKVFLDNKNTLNNYTSSFNTTDWYWQGDDIKLNITGETLIGGILAVSTYHVA